MTSPAFVWVAEIGVQDPEFYAEGTEVSISIHASRNGAIREVRRRFSAQGAKDIEPQFGAEGAASGEVADVWSSSSPFRAWLRQFIVLGAEETFSDLAERLECEPNDIRFQWTWAIYPRTVHP